MIQWVGEPVLLYGHSLGAVGAIIAAAEKPGAIRALILEGSYARTREALRSLYRGYNWLFGVCFGPCIVFWMDVLYGFKMDRISPVRLAPRVRLPVLIIHGALDRFFPPHHATRLRDGFPPGCASLFVAEGAGHSDSSLTSEYPAVVRSFVREHLLEPSTEHAPAADTF